MGSTSIFRWRNYYPDRPPIQLLSTPPPTQGSKCRNFSNSKGSTMLPISEMLQFFKLKTKMRTDSNKQH